MNKIRGFVRSHGYRMIQRWKFNINGPERMIKKRFEKEVGKKLNLSIPKTFNEKIQWLKLNYFQSFYIQACDKFLMHDYLKKNVGKDYGVPILLATKNIEDLRMESIKTFPCILKISNGSGQNLIIRNKDEYTDNELQSMVKQMIYKANTHAMFSCESQYLTKSPYIVVEKLLKTKSGKIPNDYKLFYLNGELTFIYCSVDRLGENVRHLYDVNWNRIDAVFLPGDARKKYDRHMTSKSINRPSSFEKMKELGSKLSKDFPLLRVDFYDVDGQLYIGELTLHHGSGFDNFYPEKYDEIYGRKLKLPKKNYTLKI